jgi:hypothetical protein
MGTRGQIPGGNANVGEEKRRRHLSLNLIRIPGSTIPVLLHSFPLAMYLMTPHDPSRDIDWAIALVASHYGLALSSRLSQILGQVNPKSTEGCRRSTREYQG